MKTKAKASKTQVKKAVHQHEARQHPGQPKTKLKLGRKPHQEKDDD